jgi:predicted aconitase with swiveling domain
MMNAAARKVGIDGQVTKFQVLVFRGGWGNELGAKVLIQAVTPWGHGSAECSMSISDLKQRARAWSSMVLVNQLAFLLSLIPIAVDSRG